MGNEIEVSAREGHVRADRLIPAAFTLAHAAALLLLIFLFLGGFDRDFGVPIRFDADSLAYLTQTKTTLDTGWWWTNPRLSAPSSFNALLFPSNSTVNQSMVWLVGLITRDVGLVMNLTWFFMLALSGIFATFCLRVCGVSRAAAMAAGTLFALSPYAIYRNLEHFMLVTYLVPFASAAAVLIASGAFEQRRWRSLWFIPVGCALLGLNYVYYAFFACVFIGVATLGRFLAGRNAHTLAAGALCVGLIIAATGVNLLPSLRAWAVDGKPVTIQEKVPAESEVYGLKIRHLISPVWGHTVSLLARWNRIDEWARFPLETENRTARLGIVASVGFLGGLLAVFVGLPHRAPNSAMIFAAGQMLVAGVLFATIGGFGTIFNVFVAPDIRGYSRVSPFLSFFSLLVVALACDMMGPRRTVKALLLVGVLAIGLWDQRHPFAGINQASAGTANEYRRLEALVKLVETELPRGARVVQLPFTIYLNDPGRARMGTYDQFKPYLVSHHLRWSFPALSNEQFRWEQIAMKIPVELLPAQMAREGFAAIWVDTYGYEDGGASVLATLASVPGSHIVWRDERYSVVDIREVLPAANAISTESRPATVALPRCRSGSPMVSIEYVGGSPGPYSEPTPIARHRNLRITGWLLPDGKSGVTTALDTSIDGTLLHAYIGFPRPDVSAALGGAQFQDSGFTAVVPAASLPPGRHQLSFRAVSVDGSCYTETSPIVLISR